MLRTHYRNKKELKTYIGHALKYSETSLFKPEYKDNAILCVCGPHFCIKCNWYAEVTMENGLIKKVN